MIIILSEAQDVSSQKVMTWLNQFNQDIWCLNGSTFIDEIEIEGDKITINGLSLEKCSSIWDRRGNLSFQLSHSVFPKSILGNLCSSEWKILRDYLYFLFNEKGVGSFLHESAHNKFIDLHLAQKVGLSIPHSFVVSTKIKLAELLSRYELITKPLNDAKSVEYGGYHYENEGTQLVYKNELDNIADNFFPMLFQEKIDKLFEIRVFYWLGKCYSMTIFSQLDTQTSVDYRNYNKVVSRTKINKL